MILGISASGRKGKVTEDAVMEVLKNTGHEYRFISLHGKRIGGCRGCLLCAGDNACRQKDDWNELGEPGISVDVDRNREERPVTCFFRSGAGSFRRPQGGEGTGFNFNRPGKRKQLSQ